VKSWDGLVWEDDSTHGRHRELAIDTVQTLMAATDTIPIPAAMLASGVQREQRMSLEDVEVALRRAMRAKLKKWEQGGRLNAMIEMASLRKPFLEDIASFDRDPMLLTVANGVLDLQTATVSAARPEQKLTKALTIPYDPQATCPRFERFLREIFPTDTDDLVAFLQRWIGLCLTGVVRDHLLPIFWGDGSNGKTTLLKILRALLGPYGQVAPLSLLLDTGRGSQIPNDRARLFGVRCVVTSETPERGRLDEQAAKTLTGGDPLTGRFLHKEYFDFDPTHKVLLVTNHKPVIRGQDHAIWRRLALVPFTVKFWRPEDQPPAGAPLADPGLSATLLGELPGILAWAVRGCLAWQQDGAIVLPKIVRVATSAYRHEQDRLGEFLEDCIIVESAAWISTTELYSRYETWAFQNESKKAVLSKKALGLELAARGFRPGKQHGARGWEGLRLRTEADPVPADHDDQRDDNDQLPF
jgi:putative DNA primase/helicase